MYESKAIKTQNSKMTKAQEAIYKKLSTGKKSAFRKLLTSNTFRAWSPAKRAAAVQKFGK